jgi:DNA repair protein RadC
MAITDWPEDERPRERLLANGAASLSDAELLAIFLRVGVRGKSAVDLARELIGRFGGLTRMFAANSAEFSAVPGMGPAKYAQLQAVVELARRALAEDMKRGNHLCLSWCRTRLPAAASRGPGARGLPSPCGSMHRIA